MATIDLSKLEHEGDGSDARIQSNCELLALFFAADQVIYKGSESYTVWKAHKRLTLHADYNRMDGGWLVVECDERPGVTVSESTSGPVTPTEDHKRGGRR